VGIASKSSRRSATTTLAVHVGSCNLPRTRPTCALDVVPANAKLGALSTTRNRQDRAWASRRWDLGTWLREGVLLGVQSVDACCFFLLDVGGRFVGPRGPGLRAVRDGDDALSLLLPPSVQGSAGAFDRGLEGPGHVAAQNPSGTWEVRGLPMRGAPLTHAGRPTYPCGASRRAAVAHAVLVLIRVRTPAPDEPERSEAEGAHDRGARAHLRVDGPAFQNARAGACQVADAVRAQRCSRRRVGVASACAMGDGYETRSRFLLAQRAEQFSFMDFG